MFSFDKGALVAGCRVDDGTLFKSEAESSGKGVERYLCTVTRDGRTVVDGCRIATMRHVKKSIPSAGKGMECGITLDAHMEGVAVGDRICGYENVRVKPSLS